MHFIPSTKAQEKEMLQKTRANSFSNLIEIISPDLLYNKPLNIRNPLSEIEIESELQEVAGKNDSNSICFMGNGVYDHYVPKAVDFIAGRSEFYTAYTPYQAEVSQGTLQYLYEFQTMICELSGMDVANASLYDGGSSVAEACSLALSFTRKKTILYSQLLNSNYLEVIKTYLWNRNVNLVEIPSKNGVTELKEIQKFGTDIAGMILQSPNHYGLLEDWKAAKNLLPENALLIAVSDPVSLSIIKSPGESGADIYAGEGQSLGNYMSYGGPFLGLIATKQKYMRYLPGRIIGKTVDRNNNSGFVLTLQTREQHIRRERATSNICTNQGLLALRATVYIALMSKIGLPKLAHLSYEKAQHAAKMIDKLENYSVPYGQNFIKEFVVRTSKIKASIIVNKCLENWILIQSVKNDTTDSLFIIAVTEKRTDKELDKLIAVLESA